MYKTIVKVQIPTILNKLKEILTGVKPEVDYFSKQDEIFFKSSLKR